MSPYLRNETVPAAKIRPYPKRTWFTGPADDLRTRGVVADGPSMNPHPGAAVATEVCYGDFFRVPVEVAS